MRIAPAAILAFHPGMKFSAVIAILLLGLALRASAQDQQGELVKPTPAAEAKSQVGTNAVIVGTVAEVSQNDKIIRLNFEARFPKQVFTAVIFPSSFKLFTNLTAMIGKKVEVSGKVVDYNGRPQIVVASKGQLRVLEAGKPEPVAPPAAK